MAFSNSSVIPGYPILHQGQERSFALSILPTLFLLLPHRGIKRKKENFSSPEVISTNIKGNPKKPGRELAGMIILMKSKKALVKVS